MPAISHLLVVLTAFILDDVYMTGEEAMDFAFNGSKYHEYKLIFTDEEYETIKKTLTRNDIEPSTLIYYRLDDSGSADRFAVIVNEVGKYKDITFIVVLDRNLAVDDVAVMVYREPEGSEVRRKWWLKQFKGKKRDSPIKRNRDVINITGATLSCDAICRGIRKAIAFAEIASKRPLSGGNAVERQFYVMGTTLTIKLEGNKPELLAGYCEESYKIAKSLDKLLSNYRDDSEISLVNAGAGKAPVEVSPITFEFVEGSFRLAAETGGRFDPTVLPAVKAWGFLDKKFRIPPREELESLRALVDYRGVELNSAGRTIALKNSGAGIDSGGSGKGFCVRKIADYLNKCDNITRAFIDFGSSQYGLVKDKHAPGWEVRVRDPSTDSYIGKYKLVLVNEAVSTSGAYEKSFNYGGKSYCHIIDPETCAPRGGISQVTLIGSDAFELDALSTAVFVMGVNEGLEFATRKGIKAIIVDNKGVAHTNFDAK